MDFSATLSVLFWSLTLALPLVAQEPPSSADMALPSHAMTGAVVYSDGTTPLRDLPIKVWNVDRKKMVYRSRTDENGNFRIPRLMDQGNCYLFVGYVKINMRLLVAQKGADIQEPDIIVALPRLFVTAAAPEAMSSLPLLSSQILDVLIAPVLIRPPSSPDVVSP